jgi:TRAP-type mannitol/chloroaromatic compound transport system permease large subunit
LILSGRAHSHFPGVLYQFFCLEYSKWVGKRIKNQPFGRVQLIIQKKMNLSFIAFFVVWCMTLTLIHPTLAVSKAFMKVHRSGD